MAKKLNENQKLAVYHEDGPMLVLAGPGSGKTTVLLCRILRLYSNKSVYHKTFPHYTESRILSYIHEMFKKT